MDIARWGLGKTTHPKRVFSAGGNFVYDDDQETPNTQIAVFEYDDCQLQFEVRGLHTGGEASIYWDGGNYIGNEFFGSNGYLSMDASGFQVYLGDKRELSHEVKASEPRIWDTTPHVVNFLAAVKSRNHADLSCDIETAHMSSSLCHLANIAYRTGRPLTFEPRTETIVGDADASRLMTRQYRPPFVVPSTV
jgi:hypothetical protein